MDQDSRLSLISIQEEMYSWFVVLRIIGTVFKMNVFSRLYEVYVDK